jgi:signal transduction histidine kinase
VTSTGVAERGGTDRALRGVVRALSAHGASPEGLGAAVGEAAELLGANAAAVVRWDGPERVVVVACSRSAASGDAPGAWLGTIRAAPDDEMVGRAPVVVGGRTWGELVARVPGPGGLSEEGVELLTDVASLVGLSLGSESADRELESLARALSHDLRSPLVAIEGFGALLQEAAGAKVDAETLGYLERVRSATREMSSRLEAMATLVRIARAEIRPQRLDISEVAAASLDRLRAADPGRRVEAHIPQGLTVTADAALAGRLIDNLMANAWAFTRRRDPARIRLAESEERGEPVISVRDNGIGFDSARASRLFLPFTRLHGDPELEGQGVGLAECLRVVQRHGGRIWAQGEPGRGATVRFTLGTNQRAVPSG